MRKKFAGFLTALGLLVAVPAGAAYATPGVPTWSASDASAFMVNTANSQCGTHTAGWSCFRLTAPCGLFPHNFSGYMCGNTVPAVSPPYNYSMSITECEATASGGRRVKFDHSSVRDGYPTTIWKYQPDGLWLTGPADIAAYC